MGFFSGFPKIFKDPAPHIKEGGYQPVKDPGPPPTSLFKSQLKCFKCGGKRRHIRWSNEMCFYIPCTRCKGTGREPVQVPRR